MTPPSDQVATNTIAFNAEHGTFLGQFDSHARPPSIAVVETLETALDATTPDIPPVYSVIDLEALDKLFSPTQSDQPRNDASVQFTYEGRCVTVHSYGSVEVESSGTDDE